MPFIVKIHVNLLFACFVFFCTLSPAFADWSEIDKDAKPVFNAQSATLDNGMQIIVVPNKRAPVVHHMLWYKVGAADEEWGKGGLAHFFEHLMFRGTVKLPDGEFSRKIASLGGRENAFTGQDYTAYFETISVNYLGDVMEMEADRMVNLDLSDDVINTERKVIMEERRQRLENDPFGRFREKFNQVLYPNHPYGMPIIGWMHEIESYTAEDVRNFYKKYYAPNNAVLVITGDVSFDKALELAKKHYGPLEPSHNLPERNWTELPANLVEGLTQKLIFTDPQIRQTYWQKTFLVPSEPMDQKRAMALDLIEEILSSGQAAPIYKTLIQDKALAISANLNYSGVKKSWGNVNFSASFKSPRDIKAFKQGLEKLLSDYAHNGFSDEDIDVAKKRMIAASIYARDSLRTPAYLFGQSLTIGLSINDVEFWRDRIQTIDKEYIDETFKTFIYSPKPPAAPIESILMPEGESLEQIDLSVSDEKSE